jgi:hypothetical protein
MKKNVDVVLEDDDLATLLSRLSSQLRRDGLSLTGLAYENHRPGDEEFRTLTDMTGGLERIALMLESAGSCMCESCRMKPVEERFIIRKGETSLNGERRVVGRRRRR